MPWPFQSNGRPEDGEDGDHRRNRRTRRRRHDEEDGGVEEGGDDAEGRMMTSPVHSVPSGGEGGIGRSASSSSLPQIAPARPWPETTLPTAVYDANGYAATSVVLLNHTDNADGSTNAITPRIRNLLARLPTSRRRGPMMAAVPVTLEHHYDLGVETRETISNTTTAAADEEEGGRQEGNTSNDTNTASTTRDRPLLRDNQQRHEGGGEEENDANSPVRRYQQIQQRSPATDGTSPPPRQGGEMASPGRVYDDIPMGTILSGPRGKANRPGIIDIESGGNLQQQGEGKEGSGRATTPNGEAAHARRHSRTSSVGSSIERGSEGGGGGIGRSSSSSNSLLAVPVAQALPTLGGASPAGGSDGLIGGPVIQNATAHQDADHILSLSPDQIRLYHTWKSSKRLSTACFFSMGLTTFWVLRFRAAFALLLVPLMGWYGARSYSLLVTLAFLVFQCLPPGLRLYAIFTGRLHSQALEILYVACIPLEVVLLRLAWVLFTKLRKCQPIEIRLLRTVYHNLFRQVERQTEGFWTC